MSGFDRPPRRRANPLIAGFHGFLFLAFGVMLPMCCSDKEEMRCMVPDATLWAMSIPIGIGTGLALAAFLSSCCWGDNTRKKRLTSGCLYLLSCLVAGASILWFTNILWIGRPRPTPKTVHETIGMCLFLPWTSLVFLLIAGVLELRKKDEAVEFEVRERTREEDSVRDAQYLEPI